MKCMHCKKEFDIPYNKNKDWKFCSLNCCYAWRRDNSVGWNLNREKALKRSGHACERCGKKADLHVHHKEKAIYRKGNSPGKGSDNSLGNLEVLCNSCHKKEHATGIKRFTGRGICLKCGKQFRYYPNNHRGKYCSRECAFHSDTSIRIKLKCDFCNKDYIGNKKSKFCSTKCKSRGFYKKYGRKK